MAVLGRNLLWAAILVCCATAASAQGLPLAEQKIKAGMLYNFMKYTDWPTADAGKPMAICLLGKDLFDGNLAPLEGRSVNQRLITIRRVNAGEAASCQVLVVGNDAQEEWPSLRDALKTLPTMTVGEGAEFTRDGGMFAFTQSSGRITVLMNQAVVTQAKLSVQQRLLNLVTVSKSEGQ